MLRVDVLLKDEPSPQLEVKVALEQVFIGVSLYIPAFIVPSIPIGLLVPGVDTKEFNLCLIRPWSVMV